MILHKILSFLPCFEVFLLIFGYQIVVFCCVSWYFRGVEDSGENCVPSGPVKVPFRSGAVTLVVTNQCSLCSNLRFSCFFFSIFLFSSEADRTWSLFVQRWTGHGRQNSNDVCGIVWQAYGPLGFPTFPSLFLSPFHLPPQILSLFQFFLQFFLFSPFSLLPSFFPLFFHNLPVIFHHFLQFHAFPRVFWSKRRVSM